MLNTGKKPPGEHWSGPHFRALYVGETIQHKADHVRVDDLSLAAIEPQVHWRYTISGFAWLQSGNKRRLLEPGTALACLMPVYGEIVIPKEGLPWRYLTVNLTGTRAIESARWVIERFGLLQGLPLNSGIVEATEMLINGLNASPAWDEHTWSSRTYEWFQKWWSLAERHTKPMKSVGDLECQESKLVGFAHGSVKEFAAQVGYSPSYLTRKIKRAWCKTPGEALRRARLDEAVRLLEETTIPVAAIATKIGYASPSAFTRAFRLEYSTTPLKYRRKA
ncbi:helix-turn-helix domain-containing protein [Nibricoccus sp. IMCC34717]|uniref:helix-turn-helix domain-containing protein n=1 Tax=Nibricoccus sp. IMCC34717 TaxID=3034021 RepID=UPI00384B46EF